MALTSTPLKLVIVLGMHRSGTSAITKCLERLGVELGDKLLPAVTGDNDKGYFEDVDFNELNVDLLSAAGCTWESLRPLGRDDFTGPEFGALRQRAFDLLLARFAQYGQNLYCIKDPRFSVLLPFWLDVFAQLFVEPLFILAVRNPQSVVRSLQTGLRGEVPDAQGYYLWLLNNAQALFYSTPYKTVVVSFDAMLENPAHQLVRIAAGLALPKPTGDGEVLDDFLDPGLNRNKSSMASLESDAEVPNEATALYKLLIDLAQDKQNLSDASTHERISNLFHELTQNARLYRYADHLKVRLNTLNTQTASLEAHCTNLESHVADLENYCADLELQRDSLETRNTELLDISTTQEEALGRYHTALTNADEALAAVYASRSWRLTAPLRTLIHKTNRARGLTVQIYRMSDRLANRDNLARAWALVREHGLLQAMQIVVKQLTRLSDHENNPASVSVSPLSDYLPAETQEIFPEYSGTVDVIIPVYKGLEFTRRCISSALNAQTSVSHRIIVINDCSPEPEVSAYIQTLKEDPRLTVLENTENLGFVKTVNLGMRLNPEHDVLLLNSDTEVTDFWLERIVAHTLLNPKVATVTPFSNNATICSFPTIYGKRTLPAGVSLETINRAFYQANQQASVVVPTGVGFCMFIARACLDQIGLFDEAAFGKGYGEENDFCMRARSAGWQNLLACDVLVFHAGEVSFQGSSSAGKNVAQRVISTRYPDYEDLIRSHVVAAEAEKYRIRAAAGIFKSNGKRTVLMVNHALGGGTQKHLHEVIDAVGNQTNVVSINPILTREHLIRVNLLIQDEQLGFTFDSRVDGTAFKEFLASCGVARIHYHHIIGLNDSFLSVLRSYPAPFDFTVHDYYSICPRINLIQGDTYCGELGFAQCNSCLADPKTTRPIEIIDWRNRHSWLITDAQRVICPSDDTLQRMRGYYPSGHFIRRYHEDHVMAQATMARPAKGETLRIAILGSLSVAKGANLVRDLVALINAGDSRIHFQLIGSSLGLIRTTSHYEETGPYEVDQVNDLLEAASADLILFPGRIPETYSYTLTEAMRTGLPILAPDVGAFSERLAHYPLGRIYDHQSSAEALLRQILDLHATELELESWPDLTINSLRVQDFYQTFYGVDTVGHEAIDLRTPDGRTALVVAETLGEHSFSPCAYIRLILPLTAGAFGCYASVKVVSVADATRYIADDLYTHRIAAGRTHVDALLDHCSKHSVRLFYDIDDDLLGIARSDHPERKFYAAHADAITRLIRSAYAVSASTQSLANALGLLRNDVEVYPNKLCRALIGTAKPLKAKPGVNIIYMGTKTHSADFKLVESALTEIKKQFGATVRIFIVGVTSGVLNNRIFEALSPPSEIACSYPLFMQWLATENIFDIGIAPLENNDFNENKSDIKFLDYSALGLATVASNVAAYASTIEPCINGLLVENSKDAWVLALKSLIDSAELRERLSNAATTYLLNERSF